MGWRREARETKGQRDWQMETERVAARTRSESKADQGEITTERHRGKSEREVEKDVCPDQRTHLDCGSEAPSTGTHLLLDSIP